MNKRCIAHKFLASTRIYIRSWFSTKVIISSSDVIQFIQGSMYRLLSLSVLVILGLYPASSKAPRIYNVLISSKKNLSPSQALPVYEPVLRTASIDYLYPPIFYHTFETVGGIQNLKPSFFPNSGALTDVHPNTREVNPQNPPAGASYLQPQDIITMPKIQPSSQNLQEVNKPYPLVPAQEKVPVNLENVENPKLVVANLKRNPDIPDVPPPKIPSKK